MLEMINQRYHYDFRSYLRDMIERRLDAFIIKNGIKNIKDAVGVIVFNESAFEEFFFKRLY
jgi:chemotaxis methyl-accepting protein methylase